MNEWIDGTIEIVADADRAGNSLPLKFWLGREPYPSRKHIEPEMASSVEKEIASNFDGHIPDEIDIEINFDYDPGQEEILFALPEDCQPGFPPSVDICAVKIFGTEYQVSELLSDQKDETVLRDYLEEIVWDYMGKENE